MSPQNNHFASLLILVPPFPFPLFHACDTVECGDFSGLLWFCLGGVLETSLHIVLLLRMNLEYGSSRLDSGFALGLFAGSGMVWTLRTSFSFLSEAFSISTGRGALTADNSQRGSADRPFFRQLRSTASYLESAEMFCHKCLITWGIF